MAVYTRVSRLDKLVTFRRARRLPYPGDVLSPVGQQVGPVQVVARAPDYMNYQILRASDVLGVDNDQLEEYLLVEIDTVIKKGMPLMRRPGLFGRSKIFRSPIDGYLTQIHDGCLVIQRTGDLIELRAQLPGRVVSIIPERGVVIEASGALIQAIWDSGKDGFGRLLKASDNAAGTIQPELVGNRARGAVLVAGTADDLDILTHLEDQGARGLILGSLTQTLSETAKDLTYPVIVTECLGENPMAEPIFSFLSQSEEREVSLLAATYGRGAQPVEIFIPLPATIQGEAGVKTIAVGTKVRVLQPGGDKPVGTVVQLEPLPRKNSLGTPMPGALVKMSGGERSFVPYTNLELLHN